MRRLAKSPGYAAAAIVVSCLVAALPPTMSAVAAERSLASDPAAACGSLSSAGTGATSIDAAALVDAKPLAVAEKGPTPASRISPATPTFCRVLGHIEPNDHKAPPIRFQVNLPLQWNGRSVQYALPL